MAIVITGSYQASMLVLGNFGCTVSTIVVAR